jgi:hypothetical protein
MKKTTFAALVAVLFAASMGLRAQQKVPGFKGTRVCVNFGGSLAIEAKTTLVKMGVDPVAGFVDRNGSCIGAPTPHVRISVSAPHKMQASSENTSASGSTPGYSSGGSYSRSGNWIAVNAEATLVVANGNYRRIGFHSNAFQAGQMSSSGSASGGTFSNSGSFSRSTPEDQTAGLATQHAIHDLLHSAKSWTPGADKFVAEAFATRHATMVNGIAVQPTGAPTQVAAINATAADILAQAKELEADAKATKAEAKAKANAEVRLKKAKVALANAQKTAGVPQPDSPNWGK